MIGGRPLVAADARCTVKARVPFWLILLLLLLMLGVLSDFLGLSIGLRHFEQTHQEAKEAAESRSVR